MKRIRNVRVIKVLREELAKGLSYVSRGGSRKTIMSNCVWDGRSTFTGLTIAPEAFTRRRIVKKTVKEDPFGMFKSVR